MLVVCGIGGAGIDAVCCGGVWVGGGGALSSVGVCVGSVVGGDGAAYVAESDDDDAVAVCCW